MIKDDKYRVREKMNHNKNTMRVGEKMIHKGRTINER